MSICPCPYVHFGAHFILFLFNFQLNFCRDSAEIMQAFSAFAAKKFVLFGKYAYLCSRNQMDYHYGY